MSDVPSGLLMGFVLDGAGGGRAIDSWDDVRAWTPADGVLWLHFDRTKPDVLRWLAAESGVVSWIGDALVRPVTRPRVAEHDDALLVIQRAVNMNPGQHVENMIALRMCISADRIITSRGRPLMVAKVLRQAITNGRGPKNAGEALTFITDDLCERAGSVIAKLEDDVDRVDDELRESWRLGPLGAELGRLRRETTGLRRHLTPQRDAVAALAVAKATWLDDADRLILREQANRLMRRIEDLDAIREQASVTQDELAARSDEELNKRLYLLAILTAIALPLSLITGLFGMEVGGRPGQGPLGFWAVCIVIGVVTAVVLVILKRLRWF